jgi:hypothetical protein
VSDDERCGGTGLISYWDGSTYVGEGCPGCIDCEPPTCPDCGGDLRGSFPKCIDCQIVEALKAGE